MSTSPCFICGGGEHAPTELHSFWSTEDAMREAVEHDRRSSTPLPSMTAVETLDPREAVLA